MKKIVMLFAFISFLSLASASFNIFNISVDGSYPLNQILRGEMNINVTDMNSDVRLTSNMGHDIRFIDLLNDSGLYTCIPSDCGDRYSMTDLELSLSFDLGVGTSAFWGFILEGSNVYVKDVSYDISSDFGEGTNVPLRMNIFEGTENWVFNEYSGTDTGFRDIRYGNFYDESYGTVGPIISDITYCTESWIYETDRVRIGFDLDLNGATGDLRVILYDKDTGTPISTSTFDPASLINSVEIESSSDDLFAAGNYYICVEAKETSAQYKLYEDTTSGKYGSFSYSGIDFDYSAAISPNKTKNYGIFLQEAVYADSSRLRNANFSIWRNVANSLIALKYGVDCSNGCVFPVRVMPGVEQNYAVENVIITYSKEGVSGGNYIENNISILDVSPAKMFFSGILDLGALNFVMNESGDLELYLDGETIWNDTIRITAAPIINGIYPSVLPAGISALLFADVTYENNGSLTYEWEFGDGSSQSTTSNSVYHLFRNISEYNIRLTVRDGNLSNFMDVKIITINPKDYVSIIYAQMSLNLNQSINDIESFPDWQKKTLNDFLNIASAEDDLRRIGRKINEAFDDNDYLEIASLLNALDIPKSVFISSSFSYDTLLAESMNIDDIVEYTGESLDSDKDKDDYVAAIARWQDEEVDVTVVSKQVSLLKTSGVVQNLFVTYLVTLNSGFSEDSFFVINKPREELVFNNVLREPKTYGTSTFLPLGEQSISYEFFVLGSDGVDFFASPLIRDLVLEFDITEGCNFNLICEEGETPSTCRSDCKPVGSMALYIILAFILGLVLYTGVQIWYTKRYEKTLFKKNHRLHNLLVFVVSAKTNGKSDVEIKEMLNAKGWTSERIDYVIRKANGERTGLYEIIPITKIGAYFRRKKIIKNKGMPLGQPPVAGPNFLPPRGHRPIGGMQKRRMGAGGIATSFKQQMGRNINKADRQNFKRRK